MLPSDVLMTAHACQKGSFGCYFWTMNYSKGTGAGGCTLMTKVEGRGVFLLCNLKIGCMYLKGSK